MRDWMSVKATGVILAGGNNRRIGIKKAFININGITIIERTLTVFRKIFPQIIIVTNTPEDFQYTSEEVVKDIVAGKGPLGGIYTGLALAKYTRCFVVACDMPYVNAQLIKYMTDIIEYDIIVPKVGNYYEPLFACYSKKCYDVIRKQIEINNLKITGIFSQVGVREVSVNEIIKFDNNLSSFININTPQDFIRLLSQENFNYALASKTTNRIQLNYNS
jgi:molybdopterin-guanine dinucleotide biosynthesis protein A